jgi:hypothetical protein
MNRTIIFNLKEVNALGVINEEEFMAKVKEVSNQSLIISI